MYATTNNKIQQRPSLTRRSTLGDGSRHTQYIGSSLGEGRRPPQYGQLCRTNGMDNIFARAGMSLNVSSKRKNHDEMPTSSPQRKSKVQSGGLLSGPPRPNKMAKVANAATSFGCSSLGGGSSLLGGGSSGRLGLKTAGGYDEEEKDASSSIIRSTNILSPSKSGGSNRLRGGRGDSNFGGSRLGFGMGGGEDENRIIPDT